MLCAALKQQSTAHWLDALLEAGVPNSEVRELAEVAADAQFEHRNAFVELPADSDGHRPKAVFSGHSASTDGPSLQRDAPRLGEHNEEILAGLGYATAEIAAFKTDGAI